MASVTVPQPQVVPFRKPTEPIQQDRLAEILSLRQSIEQLEAELRAAEDAVRAVLEAGQEVEPGILRAYLKTVERRSVPWKQVCERELGEDYCKRVLGATKPDTFTNLVVSA
jgi:hypothetical protein